VIIGVFSFPEGSTNDCLSFFYLHRSVFLAHLFSFLFRPPLFPFVREGVRGNWLSLEKGETHTMMPSAGAASHTVQSSGRREQQIVASRYTASV